MSSANGPEGPRDQISDIAVLGPRPTVECQLFESLVHHLIEKGVLTRNDALSIVQTVAQVKRGTLEEDKLGATAAGDDLKLLKRLYSSFELMSNKALGSKTLDDGKVIQLRPPLHGDHPQFTDEN